MCKPPFNIPLDSYEIQAPSLHHAVMSDTNTELMALPCTACSCRLSVRRSALIQLWLCQMFIMTNASDRWSIANVGGLINSVSSFHRGPIHTDSVKSGMIIRWVDLHSVSEIERQRVAITIGWVTIRFIKDEISVHQRWVWNYPLDDVSKFAVTSGS